MEKYTFLKPILVFIALQCSSILTLTIPKNGRNIAFALNILSSLALAGMLAFLPNKQLMLTDLFVLDAHKCKVLVVVAIFNVFIALLNGQGKDRDVKSSILSTFMLLGSIFLIGSTEFITFFVALEVIALMNYSMVALSSSENAKESAIKYFVQGSVFSALFLLGLAFFFGATGDFNFMDFTVRNQELYVVSVALMFLVLCFKLGAFPFHAWMPDVYSNVDKGNLASNFLITKLVVGYGLITVLLRLVNEVDPRLQQYMVHGVLVVAVMSAFYGNILGLAQNQFKRIIAYSSIAHAGYMLMTLCLQVDENYENQLLFYMVFYSVAATGTILLINNFLQQSGQKDHYEALKGGFYKDGPGAILLCVFVLALAGMPLTSGFTTKYLLFTNYFREGYNLEATAILVSTIIGLGYYIRFVVVLFMEEPVYSAATAGGPGIGLVDLKSKIIPLILGVLVLLGGMAPSLFLR